VAQGGCRTEEFKGEYVCALYLEARTKISALKLLALVRN
jgi:hypothetical protein